jgi:hypothetical protein
MGYSAQAFNILLPPSETYRARDLDYKHMGKEKLNKGLHKL